MEQKLPEVDDEFAQLVSEFDTVDEMRADLRTAMENMARLDQAAAARDRVLENVIAAIDFELPEALVISEVTARKDQVTSQLREAGLTLEQYLADSAEEASDADSFWADIEKRATDALKAQIVLDKYADDNEVGVEQAELTEMIFRKAQASGKSPEQEVQHMMDHNHMSEWMHEIRRTKSLSDMVAAATVTDTDGNVLDLATVNPDGDLFEDAPVGDDEDDVEAPVAPVKKAPTASDAPTRLPDNLILSREPDPASE